mgnify:CR=1 FL=1
MPSFPVICFIGITFLIAGWVKGVVGMGLPTVAMGALGLLMTPVEAASLLIIPSLVTNIWQFAAGGSKRLIAKRLATMLLGVCLGTAMSIAWLSSDSSHWPSILLGAVLAVYGLTALFLPPLLVQPQLEKKLSPLIGLVTGAIAGATGVFVIPAVPYLNALGLARDDLVQALGLSFTVSTIALAIGLGMHQQFSSASLTTSLVALIPALIGMQIGQITRLRINPVAFRYWFLLCLLFLGSYMVIRGLLSQLS